MKKEMEKEMKLIVALKTTIMIDNKICELYIDTDYDAPICDTLLVETTKDNRYYCVEYDGYGFNRLLRRSYTNSGRIKTEIFEEKQVKVYNKLIKK